MKPATLLFLLFLTVPALARLGETPQQIEARYGKPLETAKPDSPATNAEVYAKNGFRIEVGFYEGKSYYEQFRRIDPQEPNSLLEITETEREWLLNANDAPYKGRWSSAVSPLQNGASQEEATYKHIDGWLVATYRKRVFTIRSLRFEKQMEADEKKRQQENLKDF